MQRSTGRGGPDNGWHFLQQQYMGRAGDAACQQHPVMNGCATYGLAWKRQQGEPIVEAGIFIKSASGVAVLDKCSTVGQPSRRSGKLSVCISLQDRLHRSSAKRPLAVYFCSTRKYIRQRYYGTCLCNCRSTKIAQTAVIGLPM